MQIRNVLENVQYDEFGSILVANRLMFRNSIVLDKSLVKLPIELSAWSASKNKPSEGFPMARALTNKVSYLHEEGIVKRKDVPPKPYSLERSTSISGGVSGKQHGWFC